MNVMLPPEPTAFEDTKDALGDRMKYYESVETSRRIDPELPVCIRVDGRGFSRFTRDFAKPFDTTLATAMRETTQYLLEQTHARIGYTQSDEITLILFNEGENTEPFFGGKFHKLTSIMAAMATVKFATTLSLVQDGNLAPLVQSRLPMFDARVWQVPSREEAANVILWRALDARRNGLSSAARSLYSHHDLHGKTQTEMKRMINERRGIPYEECYSETDRLGTYIRRVVTTHEIDRDIWDTIPIRQRPESRTFTRSGPQTIPVGDLAEIKNKVGVLFDGEEPVRYSGVHSATE